MNDNIRPIGNSNTRHSKNSIIRTVSGSTVEAQSLQQSCDTLNSDTNSTILPVTPNHNDRGVLSGKADRIHKRKVSSTAIIPSVAAADNTMLSSSTCVTPLAKRGGDVIRVAQDKTSPLRATTSTLPSLATFPEIVHKMVTYATKHHPQTMSWVVDGEAFKVDRDHSDLQLVLKSFFRHEKYASFQRQLNMYGFTKCGAGKYTGAFYHPSFHRDDKSIFTLMNIRRRPSTTRDITKKGNRNRSEGNGVPKSSSLPKISHRGRPDHVHGHAANKRRKVVPYKSSASHQRPETSQSAVPATTTIEDDDINLFTTSSWEPLMDIQDDDEAFLASYPPPDSTMIGASSVRSTPFLPPLSSQEQQAGGSDDHRVVVVVGASSTPHSDRTTQRLLSFVRPSPISRRRKSSC